MNLYKINKRMNEYVDCVKNAVIPDVYCLYKEFGKKEMGRNIYHLDVPDENQVYFNKSIKHKESEPYIGKPKVNFYAQDLLDIRDIEERRFIIVDGNCNDYHTQLMFVDKIIKKFGIRDFIIDVFYFYKEREQRYFLMELNEIHLSSIDDKQLKFILENIL